MSLSRKIILFCIITVSLAGIIRHGLILPRLSLNFCDLVNAIPPGSEYLPLKTYLENLNIYEAGFLTDKRSENPGIDTQIMYEYHAAQYALSPARLHYFQAMDFAYIILKCFEEENTEKMNEALAGKVVVQIDNGIVLIKREK